MYATSPWRMNQMMTKKKFIKFVENANKNPLGYLAYSEVIDGKSYFFDECSDQGWHDELVSIERSQEEYQTNHAVYQLVSRELTGNLKQECNFYALRIIDCSDTKRFCHDLIPMIKTTTYHPEVVIPPHEEEHFVFI